MKNIIIRETKKEKYIQWIILHSSIDIKVRKKIYKQDLFNLFDVLGNTTYVVKVYWIHEVAIFLAGNNEANVFAPISRTMHPNDLGWERAAKDFKKTSVRRTNTFQSISPRTVVFHVPFTRSPCSFPRHSSVYRYSSVGPYLPATFQFHSTRASRCAPFPPHASSLPSNSERHKSDKFLLFSISVAGEQQLQSSPRIPLRGGGWSLGRSNTTGRER